MKWKTKKNLLLLLALTLLSIQVVAAYENQLVTGDGPIILYGGIQLKPNTIHTYIPQYNGRVKNITLNSGTLGLSKSDYAYNIACGTNDNVTINLHQWFYLELVKFQPFAENESSLSFTVNVRDWGTPKEVVGASSWSYNAATTTVSLISPTDTMVTIQWEIEGVRVLVWFLDRMMLWIGIGGFFLILLAPTMLVYYGKQGNWDNAFAYPLMLFVIGLALIIGWLWG